LIVISRTARASRAIHDHNPELEMKPRLLKPRRGFTLVETVVTVGIVAALAAVVYPTVVKQFDIADPARAAEDLNNIRTAVDAFGVNVRPQHPADIEDLVFQPGDTAGATDVSSRGTPYTPTEIQAWLGPYLGASVAPGDPAGNTMVVSTGYGAQILNRLARYDIQGATAGGDTVISTSPNADFIAVLVKGLSAPAFYSINALIDGPSEATDALRRHSGRFRCPGAFVTGQEACVSAFYMLAPIR
jgi:prepilin-type N-terminal cleavage/methylation domain-containing protein